jgi:molybdate transport system ATP-binding protein
MAEGNGEYYSVFDCEIKDYDKEFGVISAEFAGGIIHIISDEPPEQQEFRAAIKASDVTVSLTKPEEENISTTNIFRGTIKNLEKSADGGILVHTNIGAPLAAHISRASGARLGLEPGKEIYLLVKAASMIY